MNICNQGIHISIPSLRAIKDALWVYPNHEFNNKANHIVLLIGGKDNTGFGVWSWSYAAQLPHDFFVPATLRLPYRNTGDLNFAGKYIPGAIDILKNRYPNHKISIVAHSMGNLAMAWALHYRPTFMAKQIDSYVAIGAPFQGTTDTDKYTLKQPALYQCNEYSDFIREINSTPFPSPVRYLSIISLTDEISDGKDPEVLASFPKGTVGQVQIPQKFFEDDKDISHVGEVADNGIYEMVRAFLRNMPVIKNAAEIDTYPYLEKEGLELTVKFGREDSHRGDAPEVEREPPLWDQIV